MAKFYTIDEKPKSFSDVCRFMDATEEERLGNGKCIVCGCQEYIVLPEWNPIVVASGKQYVLCFNCLATHHL